MSLIETMLSAVNGGVGQQIASKFGLDTSQVSSVASTVAPALAGGLKEKLAAGGGDGLMDMLNSGSLTKLADDPASVASPEAAQTGQTILSQLFGGGNVLTELVSTVSQKTGISAGVIQNMLPIVTSLFMGALAKSAKKDDTGRIDTSHLTGMLDALTGGHEGIFGALKAAAAKLFG
jgi:hypothetical protein